MMTTGSLVFGLSIITLLATLTCVIVFLNDRGHRQARSAASGPSRPLAAQHELDLLRALAGDVESIGNTGLLPNGGAISVGTEQWAGRWTQRLQAGR